MAESTKGVLHVKIPIRNKKNDTIIAKGHLFLPADSGGWIERLMRDAEGFEATFLSISSVTDCPGTYDITFSPCPSEEALIGMEKGTHFGIQTDIQVIRALRDALDFHIREYDREKSDAEAK